MLQARPQFESQQNQQLIANTILKDFSTSEPLSQDEYSRLPRMIKHYMGEVRNIHGNKPVTMLNYEVMRACVQQILGMRPAETKQTPPVDQELTIDTNRRYEQLQTDRNSFMKRETPPTPNFMIEANEERTSAMELFQRAKAAREEEMKISAEKNAVFQAQSAGSPAPVYQPNFQAQQTQAQSQQSQQKQSQQSQQSQQNQMQILGQSQQNQMQTQADYRSSDMRDIIRQPLPTLQQDLLQRKTDILSYKENEYNLFISSADRNWYIDTEMNYAVKKENRYDFSVSFNPANNRHGFAISPEAQVKFKNISRIELVKAIIPTESVDIYKTQYGAGLNSTSTFDGGVNVLSFPYLMVRVDELDSNNYGTNNGIDSAFGLIQYDNKWNPDTVDYREYGNSVTIKNPGYVCMIPKFMKCQRVYDPTPLSTLQRMTVRIERPDKALVNGEMDTFDWSRLALVSGAAGAFGYSYSTGNPFANVNGSDYIILEAKSVFNGASIIAGDRIYIKGYQIAASTTTHKTFIDFINRVDGHIVSAVQGLVGGQITDTPNKLGYSKFIIIQGIPNIAAGDYENLSAIATDITVAQPCCRGLNGSRQVQLVFRITTKEIDSSSHLRPDII
jgi:hypothetical protein